MHYLETLSEGGIYLHFNTVPLAAATSPPQLFKLDFFQYNLIGMSER